jgi:hypothetical protein
LTKAREASYSKSSEREASLAFTNIFNKEEPDRPRYSYTS